MFISDIKEGQGKINIVVEVKKIYNTRVVNKRGKSVRTQLIVVGDGRTTTNLLLFDRLTSLFSKGDKIELVNGYAYSFWGGVCLTHGRFGSVKKIED